MVVVASCLFVPGDINERIFLLHVKFTVYLVVSNNLYYFLLLLGHSRQSMRSSIMNSVSQNQNHSPKAGGGTVCCSCKSVSYD